MTTNNGGATVVNAQGFKDVTQNRFELEEFLDFLTERRVKVFCEIGLYAGTTLLAVHEALRSAYGPEEPLVLIGVDLPMNQGAFNHLTSIVRPEIEKDKETDLRLFFGNSTAPNIVEGVHRVTQETDNWLNPLQSPASLVFIDGDHSFRQSKDDYLAYRDMFQYTAMNDVSPRCSQKNLQKHGHDIATVAHLWAGLTLNMHSEEYVEFEDVQATNPRGIGILL